MVLLHRHPWSAAYCQQHRRNNYSTSTYSRLLMSSGFVSLRRSTVIPLLLSYCLLLGLFGSGMLAVAQSISDPASAHSRRAGLCGPMGGTPTVEASKAAGFGNGLSYSSSTAGDDISSKASTWVDPSDVPSCRKNAEEYPTQRVSRNHKGTTVTLLTYKDERSRPSSTDDSSGDDSSDSSSADAPDTQQTRSSSSSSSSSSGAADAPLPILAVPVQVAFPPDGATAGAAVRGLLQADAAADDIAGALVNFIARYLDSSAASNAWPRERVTAVGLTRDAANPNNLLSFTVLYQGEEGDLSTLTAQSVALVGDSGFDAQVVGASYTTTAVGPDTLTFDKNSAGVIDDLEQLRLNLGTPVGQQVNVPAAPVTTTTTTPGATTTTPAVATTTTPVAPATTPGATTTTPAASTTTPAATTTAGCNPCTVDATAVEGWIFGSSGESCDDACSSYKANWVCSATELNTINTPAKFESARESLLDCSLPPGGTFNCNPNYIFQASPGMSFSAPSKTYTGYSYLYSTMVTSACDADEVGTYRLCYCKEST